MSRSGLDARGRGRRAARALALLCAAVLLFGVSAPAVALAAEDAYESQWISVLGPPPLFIPMLQKRYDNSSAGASTISGTPSTHTFQTSDLSNPAFATHDEDWASFSAVAGSVYDVMAYPSPGSTANPTLFLYAPDGTTILAVSDDAVMGKPLAWISWTCPANGTYYASAVDWWGPSTGQEYRFQVSDAGGRPPWTVTRPTAPDRYQLAANLAAAGWPGWTGVTDVIVVCGADRAAADPLSASGLAGVYNAPILLVRTDPTKTEVPLATKDALNAIRTATGQKPQIHVVGGPVSVTSAQATTLKAYDRDGVIDRISGADRYAVAAAVAKRMRSVQGAAYVKTALFANGADAAYFWNALAAGPLAYRQHFPILLTKKGSIPSATSGQKSYYTTRLLVGTPADSAESVRSSLGATRIGYAASDGASYDRTKVARRVTEYASDSARSWIGVGGTDAIYEVAYANRLADGIVGGAFMGKRNGPVLFTSSAGLLDSSLPGVVYTIPPAGVNEEWLVGHRWGSGNAWILGGDVSITPAVKTNIQRLLGATP